MDLRKLIISVSVGLGCVLGIGSAAGQTTRPGGPDGLVLGVRDGSVRVPLNKGTVLTTRVPYSRVSVAQPDIADVTPVGPVSILLTAKKAGSTQLIIWDDQNRSEVIEVTVAGDLAILQDQLNTMFKDSKIDVMGSSGSIVLRGRVPNIQTAEQAVQIATPFGKVLNFLEVGGGQQVMLQVRFAEVPRPRRRRWA